MTKEKQKLREVRVVSSPYQPSKADLEADLRVDASFDEAVKALARPVRIREVSRPVTGKRD